MALTTILLTCGAAFIAAATILPVFQTTAWWVRFWDFPRPQLMALSLALLAPVLAGGHPAWLKTVVAAVLLALAACQAFKIYGYTPFSAHQSLEARCQEPGRRVRLLISNVQMDNRDAGRLLRHVREREPHVILLLEPDRWWEEQFRAIEHAYPHSIKCPLDNTYGMLLYSRLPLSRVEVNYLLRPDVPSFFSELRIGDGRPIHLHCLHPIPPHVSVDTTHRDAELVLVGRRVRAARHPSIVAGDLNDVAWSYTTKLFQKISGTLDPRRGRGFFNTYHARWPVARWPLDHLFHSPAFRFVMLERLPPVGSDHFAILAELSFEPGGAGHQSPPEMDEEDNENASRKVREAGEEGMLGG